MYIPTLTLTPSTYSSKSPKYIHGFLSTFYRTELLLLGKFFLQFFNTSKGVSLIVCSPTIYL